MNRTDDDEHDAVTDPRLLLLSPNDNILVLRGAIDGGERIQIDGLEIFIKEHIGLGHKLACQVIASGNKVLKYGVSIGSATGDIGIGDHVHVHNMKSDYIPTYVLEDEGG
ncbi:MAG: hydrolase [Blastopirellula sp.]|nr:MAG: hydrolase [Blastopirellula sp.]